jgi:ferredoxin-NADP reductase
MRMAQTRVPTRARVRETNSGRPRMIDALDATLLDMLYTGGRLAVQTCGPEGMMEDLRAALVDRYGIGKRDVWGGEVDLWEDGFVW